MCLLRQICDKTGTKLYDVLLSSVRLILKAIAACVLGGLLSLNQDHFIFSLSVLYTDVKEIGYLLEKKYCTVVTIIIY